MPKIRAKASRPDRIADIGGLCVAESFIPEGSQGGPVVHGFLVGEVLATWTLPEPIPMSKAFYGFRKVYRDYSRRVATLKTPKPLTEIYRQVPRLAALGSVSNFEPAQYRSPRPSAAELFDHWLTTKAMHRHKPRPPRKSDVASVEVTTHGSALKQLGAEVAAFCDREGIAGELDTAIRLAKKHFVVLAAPVVQLEQDPELDNFYLVLEITTKGHISDIVAAHEGFAREWAALVPLAKSDKIRLTYDII
jgi:hypothetical protein